MADVLEICKNLINRASVTPEDAGCQSVIADHLEMLDFKVKQLTNGAVDNLWARRGQNEPLFCFLGHTDVVPPGPVGAWSSDPFNALERDGMLYGRGAADMKGSLAAMLAATERFIGDHPDHAGSIAFLVTSDEEGEAVDGTAKVIEHLKHTGTTIDWCLVGEPTSSHKLGDTVKIGRRGSLNGKLTILGKQGHVAYPDLSDNPAHHASRCIAELCNREWNQGNENFPPTSFQISNMHAGTGAANVVPGEMEVLFNFRYSTASSHELLMRQVEELLKQHKLNYKLDWQLSGLPFQTRQGELLAAVDAAVQETTGIKPEHTTDGGTSDGRFIAPTGAQVVEFGPLNQTIHQVNECISLEDLNQLTEIYFSILKKLLQ